MLFTTRSVILVAFFDVEEVLSRDVRSFEDTCGISNSTQNNNEPTAIAANKKANALASRGPSIFSDLANNMFENYRGT